MQIKELERFGARINGFGADLAVFDAWGSVVELYKCGTVESRQEQLAEFARLALETDGGDEAGDVVRRFGESGRVLCAVLYASGQRLGAVSIDAGESCTGSHCEYLVAMLELFLGKLRVESEREEQIEMVSSQLAQTYEELVLLHKLSSNMKVTESDDQYLQMACDSLTDIVSVGGIAILLERVVDGEKRMVLAAGSGLFDVDEKLGILLQNRLGDELAEGKEALLDSDAYGPFKFAWPESIRSVIAVPLYGKENEAGRSLQSSSGEQGMIGLMVAINRLDKPDFDSTDIKLFNSVANGCAVFIENGKLFADLKDLFIGSLKALTNSIDAKDQYTRGHSERVAFISRWIAERLARKEDLGEELIHRTYLAGLLHDIGKMGISEQVLRKEGKLTAEEMEHIRQHPLIGAGILGEIKQMRDIVPGVLCHHERIDGRGYPHGLKGEQIPLIGKIVGLADGFDAMTSKRVYRDALSVPAALAEVEKGLGTQFDENIGRLFLESNIYELWDAIQDGSEFIGQHGSNSFAEYGKVAVGTLIQ